MINITINPFLVVFIIHIEKNPKIIVATNVIDPNHCIIILK